MRLNNITPKLSILVKASVIFSLIGFPCHRAYGYTLTVGPSDNNSWDLTSNISGNTITLNKTAKPFNNLGFFDTEISVVFADSDPDNITLNFIENVTNNTGLHWTDYHIELGFGGIDGVAPFTPFKQSDELDRLFFLDNPAPVNSSDFVNPPQKDDLTQADSIWWLTGKDGQNNIFDGVSNGASTNFTFSVNVNRNASVFTLRQRASVPEPTSIISLLVLGGIGVASIFNRKSL